jgi:4-hydroxybenzoate polyprenyltransferase
MKKFLSLVKFSHTIFAMPFAIIGFVLNFKTGTFPDETDFYWGLQKFLLVIACMVTARNAAMAFNRYADRKFDKENPRTVIREIPSGVVSERQAIAFIVLNVLLFITATYFINTLCFALSPVALAVILGYSYMKRFTALCHIVLGIGLALAPVGAFIAISGKFHILPVLLGFTVLFWVSGFDIIYALQDDVFDAEKRLHSIPAALGRPRALMVSRILHALSFLVMLSVGFLGQFGILYWIGAAIFGALLIRQHSLVSPNDLSKVDMAFFTLNGIASVIFGLLVVGDILLTYL